MAQTDGRVIRAARIFDEVRGQALEHKAFTRALKERYVAAGLIIDDFDAYQMDEARSLTQKVRKHRFKHDESLQAPLNFTMYDKDGNPVEYNKAIEDTTPEECADFIQREAKKVDRAKDKIALLHSEFKDLHGRKYLRQLKLDIRDYLPPEPADA